MCFFVDLSVLGFLCLFVRFGFLWGFFWEWEGNLFSP